MIEKRKWILGWGGRVTEVLLFQISVQIIGAIAGLVVLKALSKSQYAIYAIIFQMQATSAMLSELGVGLGLRSIGGKVWENPRDLGSLLSAALSLRRTLTVVSLIVCCPVAIWLLVQNGAGVGLTVALCAAMALNVLLHNKISILNVVPMLHGEYRRLQLLDLASSLVRLGLLGVAAITSLSALIAFMVGTIGSLVQMIWLPKWAREHADCATPANADYQRQLRRLCLRQLPNALFFCFQAQLTIFVLTVFGNSAGIADLTALGRLGALLTAFSSVFGQLLVPRFARLHDARRIPGLYFGLLATALLPLASIALVAVAFPKPLLWILGPQYSMLENVFPLVLLSTCLISFNSVIWQLNSVREWIGYTTTLYIPVTMVGQAVLVMLLDLSRTESVAWFQLMTGMFATGVMLLDGIVAIVRTKYKSTLDTVHETMA